jgi:hypothetical protein
MPTRGEAKGRLLSSLPCLKALLSIKIDVIFLKNPQIHGGYLKGTHHILQEKQFKTMEHFGKQNLHACRHFIFWYASQDVMFYKHTSKL